jgi:uncharacterized protein involved in type VI secretion and phage assembly
MSRRYGVVVGRVEEVEDPQGEGRVRVAFPWLGCGNGYWAPVATLMSGGGRGSWFMPEVGDEVLVAFEQGDVNHPYVIGFLHNGEQLPPETDRQVRVLHSVNGHRIELRDPDVAGGDTGGIRIADAHGNVVELDNARISIRGIATIDITAPTVTINGRPVAPVPFPI